MSCAGPCPECQEVPCQMERVDCEHSDNGKWINCKKGLRQGGPLSPYLFILVADVLQQLLTSAAANGVFAHPIVPSAPCPILQYADDTLIILKADKNQLFALKETLQIFSIATRLHINFEKSNFLPISLMQTMLATLPPFLNAMSPLSPAIPWPSSLTTKLCTKDFLSMIAASEYLAG